MAGSVSSIRRSRRNWRWRARTSSRVIMPMSPWLASAGCRKKAGVPVLASVAAILPRDVARLAHAGDDDAAGACQAACGRPARSRVEACHERGDGARPRSRERVAPARRSGAGWIGGVMHRFGRVIGMQCRHRYTGLPAKSRYECRHVTCRTHQPSMIEAGLPGAHGARRIRRRHAFRVARRRPAVRGPAAHRAPPARLRRARRAHGRRDPRAVARHA